MKTIILVEDDTIIRDSFKLLLDKSEYRLQLYWNGHNILNGEVETPDLFILDRKIAGVSGINLCYFIKQHEKYKQVPVLMISSSPDIAAMAKEAGAEAAMEKPFSVATAREMIKSIFK